MQAQKIIVIHPGSQSLRIGRASDLNPLTILHAIARRRDNLIEKAKSYHDSLLPVIHDEALNEFETQRLQVSHTIQAQVPVQQQHQGSTAKRLRVATPPQQIATFNRRCVPENISHKDDESTVNGADKVFKEEQKETLYDRDILSLDATAAANYNVHFPMKRGEFNLHNHIGGSIASVMADMEAIWVYGLHCLGIAAKSLPDYTVVLVIPDVYNRSHLRELVILLLLRLRFRACFLLQDHVAATFGAGFGYACVVDIGDQKCSVSCVEDGISQPDTRVRIGYGGGDVTQVFHKLLKKCCFPYKECDALKDYSDAALLKQLKERFCHLNFEQCGAQERTFEVHKPGKHLRYTIQLGDECIVAPMALFYTELFNITGKNKRVCTQLPCSQHTDAEDCFDSEYIRETGRRNGRDQMLEGTMPITGETPEVDDVVVDAEEIVVTSKDNDSIIAKDREEFLYSMPNGQIFPLDQAIVRSIERCSNDEIKRKMYSCILLVGGSSKFPGLSKWLEQQVLIFLHRNHNRCNESPNVEVNVFMKDMDASIIAWKGAAIMSCLESAPELWITGPEWAKNGIRILREKAPFVW